MNTGPFHSARNRNVVLVLCLVKELRDFHLSTNDIEACIILALDQWQKGPREQKNKSSLPMNFFHSERAVHLRSRCFRPPCPDAAHAPENPPPVTYVPSPSRFAGSPGVSQPPPKKAASENFKSRAPPLFSARRYSSSSERDVGKERSRMPASSLSFGGRFQRLVSRHPLAPPCW
jgi:hypothetical protein